MYDCVLSDSQTWKWRSAELACWHSWLWCSPLCWQTMRWAATWIESTFWRLLIRWDNITVWYTVSVFYAIYASSNPPYGYISLILNFAWLHILCGTIHRRQKKSPSQPKENEKTVLYDCRTKYVAASSSRYFLNRIIHSTFPETFFEKEQYASLLQALLNRVFVVAQALAFQLQLYVRCLALWVPSVLLESLSVLPQVSVVLQLVSLC